MGRKRKTAISLETGEELEQTTEQQAPPQSSSAPPPPPKASAAAPIKTSLAPRRLSIELNDDGSIAWNSMRETNVIELRNLFQRAEVKEEFKDKAPQLFTPETCYGFYDLLGKMMAYGATRWKGIPSDISNEAFTFTDADKKLLADPTIKVLNKHAPLWALKYQDEITLGFVALTIINSKMMLARALTESRASSTVVEIPKRSDIVQ